MKVKVTRRLNMDAVRNMCIRQKYYTRGDVEAYEGLLNSIPSTPTDADFISIAKNIYKHSDIDGMCGIYGCDETAIFQGILFELYDASWTQVEVSEFEEELG